MNDAFDLQSHDFVLIFLVQNLDIRMRDGLAKNKLWAAFNEIDIRINHLLSDSIHITQRMATNK